MELCLSSDLGGLELYVFRSSLNLAEKDNVHAVICREGKLAERFKKSNISISYLTKGFKLIPLFSAIKLARIIDKNDIDTIHMHWGRDLSLAAFAKFFSRKKPRLVYTRQMQITRSKDDFYHRFIYKQVDVFIVITKLLEKLARLYLSEKDKEKVTMLYYGVSKSDRLLDLNEIIKLRSQVGLSESDFIVALFGRIEEFKGQHLVVEAINRLKQQGEDVKALIIGHAMDHQYLSGLKHTVTEQGLEKNVIFKDFVENPQQWMQACDAVVLATKEETFGLVLAEAMMVGVAVIGTNSGGVPEIIEHNKTGLLFDYGDVASLSNSILEYKNNDKLRNQYIVSAKEKAEKLFDLEQHFLLLRKIMEN